jgi:hypothetical protein
MNVLIGSPAPSLFCAGSLLWRTWSSVHLGWLVTACLPDEHATAAESKKRRGPRIAEAHDAMYVLPEHTAAGVRVCGCFSRRLAQHLRSIGRLQGINSGQSFTFIALTLILLLWNKCVEIKMAGPAAGWYVQHS